MKAKAVDYSKSPSMVKRLCVWSTICLRLPAWSPDGRFILYAVPYQGGAYAVKAFALESQSHSVPELWVLRGGDRYRFLPDGKQIVALLGNYLQQNFWMINLETGQRRQLSNLKPGYSIGSFDVSPDGRQN